MIIFGKELREKVITLGVFITCCCCVVIAIRCAYFAGKYALPLSIGFILVPLAIYNRMKWGYILARTICGVAAIGLVSVNINPFTYEDFELAHSSHSLFLLETLPFAGLAILLFYCLGEHAKMRGLK